jgi:tripartite-type tricarboxylate transporter receptor subunit TctC
MERIDAMAEAIAPCRHCPSRPETPRTLRRCLALVALAALAGPLYGQDYPARPIRLVSPNPAGGANDIIGRIVAQKLTEVLGQQVVVDNRGGAGGMIGADIVARAAPDGYTLLAASASTHSSSPHVFKKVPYDALKDFAPISLFAIVQNTMTATPALAASSVQELIALARAKPDSLRYASAGAGSSSHFAGLAFASAAGIKFVHVPYKGGAAAITAMLSGEASFNFGPAPATVSHIRAGRLKALAVSGRKRALALPDVPTVMESGVPYTMVGWFGIMAPARTPRAIVERLHAAVETALAAPETSQALVKVGAEPTTLAPAAFTGFVREEYDRFGRIIREAGITAE